jgi:hypothetical protein
MEQINFPLFTMLSAHSFPSFFSTIMNASIRKFTFFLISCILAGSAMHAAEQDNWYLASEWTVSGASGVAYYEDNSTGIGQIYIAVANGSSSKIIVYDLNGSSVRDINIATDRWSALDLAIGDNGVIYIGEYYAVTCLENDGTFKWRTGKNASISNRGSDGGGNGEFFEATGITLNQTSGEIFIADKKNGRIQVLDQNGTFVRKFGSFGSAPGQLKSPRDLVFLKDSTLLVADDYFIHYFQTDGTFIKRVNVPTARYRISIAKDGTLLSSKHLRDADGNSLCSTSFLLSEYSLTCFTSEGDIIESYNGKIRIWKRAYRTKGLPTRNVIPQPAIRGISQRSGTNIIDLDFEIIDSDDTNATVGILAAQDGAFTDTSKWILPQTWVDGTGSKIGTLIATNQVHRVSWDVKGDWAEQTGTLKFEIFCKDARRTAPLDLHFLELPLPDGNVTISRSPVKDSDFSNYYKYLLSIQSPGVNLSSGEIKHIGGSILMDSNLKVTPLGRDVYMNAVGHRWAKQAELSLAREASTPGSINAWTANRPVMPRNLPDRVNEYGFDTGTHGSRAWWVVKASSLPIPDFTFTPFDRNSSGSHQFGRRLSLDGEKLIVGYGDSNQRKLEYYHVSSLDGNLTYRTQIVPSSSGSNSYRFGQSFALDGNRLVVGAWEAYWNSMNGAGAAYLFDFNGSSYSQVARFSASDVSGGDRFGYSVDVSGNLIVSGTQQEDISGNQNSGAAYLFRIESNGSVTELSKLTHEDPKGDDYFGEQVAISADIIAVAALNDDVLVSGSNRMDAGSVTLFKIDGAGNVTRTETLTAPAPDSYVYFGRAIALSGDLLVVGEPYRYNTRSNAGQIYLYKLSPSGTAQLIMSLKSPNPVENGYFGYSVDLKGDRLVVGAYGEDSETEIDTGVAYLYQVKSDGSVTLLEVLVQPAGKSGDRMGISVSTSGKNTTVGAEYFDLPPDKWNAGGAFLFRSSF